VDEQIDQARWHTLGTVTIIRSWWATYMGETPLGLPELPDQDARPLEILPPVSSMEQQFSCHTRLAAIGLQVIDIIYEQRHSMSAKIDLVNQLDDELREW
jgi:hypothetical protein